MPSPRRVTTDAASRGHAAAVLLLCTLAVLLWGVRAAYAGPALEFFLWNLFLAAIPWVASATVARSRSPALLALSSAVWLLFLPNAPYLVTDLIHLRPRPPVPVWFDVLLFATFALAGCVLGWASLARVHARLARALGRPRAAVVIAGVIFLAGFGVYLGRFLRWNSWDVLVSPGALLGEAVAALASPRALVFSGICAALIGAGYLLVAGPPATREPE